MTLRLTLPYHYVFNVYKKEKSTGYMQTYCFVTIFMYPYESIRRREHDESYIVIIINQLLTYTKFQISTFSVYVQSICLLKQIYETLFDSMSDTGYVVITISFHFIDLEQTKSQHNQRYSLPYSFRSIV